MTNELEEMKFSEFIKELRLQKESRSKELLKALYENKGELHTYIAGRLDELNTILNAAQEVACKTKMKAA